MDEATVRASIESQFPDVDTSSISQIGSGWEFDVYLCADGWCFRFPRRAEYSTLFEPEARTHALVSPVLRPYVDVPVVELLGSPGPAFPYPFAGHRFVTGVPASDRRAPISGSLAGDIGLVLRCLHSVPEAEAAAAGLCFETENAEEWLEETLGDATYLEGISPTVDIALSWLRSVEGVPQSHVGPPVVVHNDLCPEHLLVDPQSGTLLGLIDWTDAAIGDPVLDFVVLALWRGRRFVKHVLDPYPETDAGFVERLTFLSKVRSLHWLRHALEQKSGFAKHHQWVSHAFRELDSL